MTAYLTAIFRMSTRLQTSQKIPIRIPTLRPAVSLVSLSTPTVVSDVPKQPNSAEVYLERNMISWGNQRFVLGYLMLGAGTKLTSF